MSKSIMNGKIQLLCKPCQNGKTADILDSISKNRNNKHLLISDNNLLLNSQTCERAKSLGLNCVILSSNNTCSDILTLLGMILLDDSINLVLGCANSKRFSDFTTLIDKFQKYNYSIWIDEADKILASENSKGFISYCIESKNVDSVTFITASPQESLSKSLLTEYDYIELFKTPKKDISNYHSLRESTFEPYEFDGELIEYVNSYLELNTPKNSEVWFIPAKHDISYQQTMYELLIKSYFDVVLIINSKNKYIGILDNNSKEITKIKLISLNYRKTSVSQWLGKFYADKNLITKRVAITGNACLGRGISIQSNDCFITHGLYGPRIANSKRKLYQLSARICGNIKKFPKYLENGPPKIICSTKYFEIISKMENIAFETMYCPLSKISNEEIKDMYDAYTIREPTIVKKKTLEELKAFIQLDNNEIFRGKRGPNTKKPNSLGFYETTIKSNTKVYSHDEIYKFRTHKLKEGNFMYYPCYEDTTDKNTLQWWLVYY